MNVLPIGLRMLILAYSSELTSERLSDSFRAVTPLLSSLVGRQEPVSPILCASCMLKTSNLTRPYSTTKNEEWIVK